MAIAYGNLGILYATKRTFDDAEQMLRQSLALSEELGRKGSMAQVYGNLGVIFRNRGEHDQAEEMYLKSLKIEEELGRKEQLEPSGSL